MFRRWVMIAKAEARAIISRWEISPIIKWSNSASCSPRFLMQIFLAF
jgi:hypothetical protein